MHPRAAGRGVPAPSGDFVNVICGAHKPHQIEADAPAADVKLTEQEVATIRERLAALEAKFA